MLERIRTEHDDDQRLFREIYAKTSSAQSDLQFVIDIVDGDDGANSRRPRYSERIGSVRWRFYAGTLVAWPAA